MLNPEELVPNEILGRWNTADAAAAAGEIVPCCGSRAWAEGVTARRPFATPDELFTISDAIWQNLPEDDWREAFDSHPRIGETQAKLARPESLAWSGQEQGAASGPDDSVRGALAEANSAYEAKYGRIFIVCASGKSAREILALCRARMQNDPATELLAAAEQQRQITQLRLRRWLEVN